MKNIKLLLIIAALLAVCVLFVSCESGKNDGSDTSTSSADTTDVVGADTEKADAGKLVLVKDDKSLCSVIRPEDTANAAAMNGATDVRSHIISLTNVAIGINTDWVKRGTDHDHESVEILIGDTTYSETAEAYNGLPYGSYRIKVIGNKLVVVAYSETILSNAVSKLKVLLKTNYVDGELAFDRDYDLIVDNVKTINGMTTYKGGSVKGLTSTGNNAFVIYVTDTNVDEYKAYLKDLEADGYKKYTDNNICDNLFATYTNSQYTMTVIFYNYENSVRIIMEPLADPVGLEADNKYTEVTTSCIVLVGLAYLESDGTSANNGLSLLIRLSDGRFVIVDGGFSARPTVDASSLINKMRELSADYINDPSYVGKGKIDVAAWIVSHPHSDHNGMIIKAAGQFSGIIVEKMLVNYTSEAERLRGVSAYGDNIGSTEGTNYKYMPDIATSLKAKLVTVRPGQVFYLANTKFEVLYTIDSYAPKALNAINTQSVVYKVTFASGDTLMITGDATGAGFDICNKMYGDYMKVDMVQVAHHGATTWGNDSATTKAYTYMKPTTLIWPCGLDYVSNVTNRNYNKALLSPEYITGGTNKNFKEVYFAGWEGDYVTFPIPYTVGSATEVRVK